MDVTSSTKAAERAPTAISTMMSKTGRGPTYRMRLLTNDSKNWFSSRNPTKIIIPIRKRIMSNPANSMRWGISRSPKVSRSEIPRSAKGNRNRQKRIVPKMTIKKIEMERTWEAVKPAREERPVMLRMMDI
jgi:hypothetical protein